MKRASSRSVRAALCRTTLSSDQAAYRNATLVALPRRKGGTGKLFVDDTLVAEGRIDRTMGYRISLDETFDIGAEAGEPVSESYHVPFDFQGTLDKVVVKLDL